MDKKDQMPYIGEVRLVEVIVARNRTAIGKYERTITEVFLKDGTLIAKHDPFNGCQNVSDVVEEAIDIIKGLAAVPNSTGSFPDVSDTIEKLESLIKY